MSEDNFTSETLYYISRNFGFYAKGQGKKAFSKDWAVRLKRSLVNQALMKKHHEFIHQMNNVDDNSHDKD